MFYLKQRQPSGAKLIELSDWKLFFLSREGVERFLFEAHQQGLLEYHVAGSVTRLIFPADTLDGYLRVQFRVGDLSHERAYPHATHSGLQEMPYFIGFL
jgi:hypothetical protein